MSLLTVFMSSSHSHITVHTLSLIFRVSVVSTIVTKFKSLDFVLITNVARGMGNNIHCFVKNQDQHYVHDSGLNIAFL